MKINLFEINLYAQECEYVTGGNHFPSRKTFIHI